MLFIRTRVSSISYSFSTTSNNVSSSSSNSFCISYLINSCGLFQNEAFSISKKVDFKSTSKPDSVLTLLENYGFTKPHISKLITKLPSVLLPDPLKTLKPKLDFFNSNGLHGIELAKFISRNSFVLHSSLNSSIIPSFDILKTILREDTNVIKTLKKSSRILYPNGAETLMVNLELLRYEDVPQSTICKVVVAQPRAFAVDADKFKTVVEKVKEMGFDPLLKTFVVAIRGLVGMSEATWKTKLDVYKRWGWSEDQIQTVFRKSSCCMMYSEKKIVAVMDFLVNKVGYDSFSIAETPKILDNTLKDRIIPRGYVIGILVSNGLIEEKCSLKSLSTMIDESFSDKFVKPYEKQAPELMKVYSKSVK